MKPIYTYELGTKPWPVVMRCLYYMGDLKLQRSVVWSFGRSRFSCWVNDLSFSLALKKSIPRQAGNCMSKQNLRATYSPKGELKFKFPFQVLVFVKWSLILNLGRGVWLRLDKIKNTHTCACTVRFVSVHAHVD